MKQTKDHLCRMILLIYLSYTLLDFLFWSIFEILFPHIFHSFPNHTFVGTLVWHPSASTTNDATEDANLPHVQGLRPLNTHLKIRTIGVSGSSWSTVSLIIASISIFSSVQIELPSFPRVITTISGQNLLNHLYSY